MLLISSDEWPCSIKNACPLDALPLIVCVARDEILNRVVVIGEIPKHLRLELEFRIWPEFTQPIKRWRRTWHW